MRLVQRLDGLLANADELALRRPRELSYGLADAEQGLAAQSLADFD